MSHVDVQGKAFPGALVNTPGRGGDTEEEVETRRRRRHEKREKTPEHIET